MRSNGAGTLSGHRAGVEQGQGVVQPPVIRPGLLAPAGDVQDQLEQLPADLLDRRLTGGDAAGIEVDQIVPPRASALRVAILITGAAASP